MYCNHCGHAVNASAPFCENCGHPITRDIAAENRKKNLVGLILGVFAGLMVIAVVMISVFGLGSESSDGSGLPTSTGSNISNKETHTNNAYSEGMYKVGTDIAEGEYFIYCTNSVSCYFEVASDSSGKLTSIIANDNIDTFAFVAVKTGQYLKVNGGSFVKAADASVPSSDTNGNYGPGMYRVGVDIPAGEYKVTCTGDLWCYIEVSSDSSGTLSSIVSNDNIETFAYISVEEGQYLTVNNGLFSLVK